MKRKGLSLLEILVASLILTLVLAGLLNTFLAGRRWVLHNRLCMTGGELGKYFLDPLQMDVTMSERSPGAQNGWGQANNCLTNGGSCPGPQTIDNITYTPTYARTLDSPITNINKVKVDISYPE